MNEAHTRAELIDSGLASGGWGVAEGCVLSTYRGALDLDLVPVILKGSIVSHIPEHEKFVENIGNLVTYGALRKFLE